MNKPFNLTLRVAWWMQAFQIAFGLFGAIGAIYSLPLIFVNQNNLFMFIPYAIFAYLGFANAFSTIQINENQVTVNVFYGRFRIYWKDIDLILINGPMIALLNSGTGKRLVISLAFAGKNSKDLLQFFDQQAEQRGIRYEKENINFPITHQNVRVWR
jgi:hypothetical protein